MVLAAVLFSLCLLVAVVGAIDRRFEALTGRIAGLEAELGRRAPSSVFVVGSDVYFALWCTLI